ncbi:TetR/AcrR family transcriptional regulator [Deinococcus cellulosilyticus]|uniref:TetR family transcriptional regulator n=1 Tax=Deinococcus cellulosilyticus (strain DSM 18568 / NBRC 106333 / KACC 11606 / 5516J-15) TaxID=1223518 RepID=A0A511N0G1_DEIC1|nr:TetR/AcrR family transcriptional regulator [Deinococcus cellulosilyticus]GEM45981.1 TetR family transcriptional regulator [Deinococcus cellulosilyticus NBRC 106333 = KACC 11606]
MTRINQKAAAAEKSRQLILEAAERLFAEKGFEKTSLQEICDQAGVARGTPGYFFGSKEGLYQAVLDRAFAEPLQLVLTLRSLVQQPDHEPRQLLRFAIEQFFDFQLKHPRFVRLTEWETLNGGQFLGHLPRQLEVFREALALMQQELDWQGEPEQFMIDLTALCWFPVAHAETFLKPLGVHMDDPQIREKRKQHVVDLLLQKYLPERREA